MLYETLYKLETEKFQLQDEVQLLKAENDKLKNQINGNQQDEGLAKGVAAGDVSVNTSRVKMNCKLILKMKMFFFCVHAPYIERKIKFSS